MSSEPTTSSAAKGAGTESSGQRGGFQVFPRDALCPQPRMPLPGSGGGQRKRWLPPPLPEAGSYPATGPFKAAATGFPSRNWGDARSARTKPAPVKSATRKTPTPSSRHQITGAFGPLLRDRPHQFLGHAGLLRLVHQTPGGLPGSPAERGWVRNNSCIPQLAAKGSTLLRLQPLELIAELSPSQQFANRGLDPLLARAFRVLHGLSRKFTTR